MALWYGTMLSFLCNLKLPTQVWIAALYLAVTLVLDAQHIFYSLRSRQTKFEPLKVTQA